MILSFSQVLAADFSIVKSPQTIQVNGVLKEMEVYNIDGNNFFKLRDIAFLLNHTPSQFAVNYNAENRFIETQTKEEYLANGSEMQVGNDNSHTAVKSTQKMTINGTEKELLAYNIAGNNFFKLRDLGAELNFLVDYIQETNTVDMQSQCITLKEVKASQKENVPYVEITSDGAILAYTDFSMFDEENKRIVVDIPYSKVAWEENQITTSDENLLRIRMGDQGNHVNRFVLDLVHKTEYQVFASEDKKTLIIAFSKDFEPNGTPTTIPMSSGEKSFGEQTNNVGEKSGDPLLMDDVVNPIESGENLVVDEPKYTEEELKNRIPITKMTYSSSTNKIKITGAKTFQFSEEQQEDGMGLVIDIENAVLDVEGPTEIHPNHKLLTAITIEQWDEMTVRLIIQSSEKMEYMAQENSKVLTVTVEEPQTRNWEYAGDKNEGQITLKDVDVELFTTVEDKTSNKFTVKYSESRFSCDKETVEINDEWIEYIKISTGKMMIQGMEQTNFKMEQIGKNVVITISKANEVIHYPSNDNGSIHTNSVQRNTTFMTAKISDKRVLVGKVYINNSSGLELDLNALSKKSTIAINDNTNVLIYHTHTTEGYKESGVESNFHTTNNNLNVVAVGEALVNYLKKKGISAYHDITRNDTSYNDAYDASLELAEKDLKKAHYDIVIDLHRDAVSSDYNYGPTVTINGEKAAKMMLVMGSTAYGLEHPNWMENLKMALLIQNKAEEMYPGLFRDMSLVKYRYNQHLSPGAFLIEVGATGNSMEEVQNSMKYLANVMAALDK